MDLVLKKINKNRINQIYIYIYIKLNTFKKKSWLRYFSMSLNLINIKMSLYLKIIKLNQNPSLLILILSFAVTIQFIELHQTDFSWNCSHYL